MASQSVSATSRLAQMQMKFQQKQQQERELRKIEMTGERTVSSDTTGTGKVRQMFDERRRGAGIDRSNPLKPLPATTKTSISNSTVTPTRNSHVAAAGRSRPTPAATVRRTVTKRVNTFDHSTEDLNGNASQTNYIESSYDQTDQHMMNKTFPKAFSTMSLTEQKVANGLNERNNNNSSSNNNDYLRTKSSNSIKLKPVLTKKSPTVSSQRSVTTPPSSASKVRTTPRTTGATNGNVNAQKKTTTTTPNTVKTSQKISAGKMATNTGVRAVPPAAPEAGMASCKICHRNFTEDRLKKHEQVCQKMANSKRKIFDASKHRVKGTDAESYLKKPVRISNTKPTYTSAAAATGLTPPANSAVKKNNWRQKHEEFISAIRAAKQVQAHLAKGGKLSDLPPPPPSENPDYIQCPHCQRRFNESAAERHIPRCANMIHNKPKPNNNNAKKR